MLQDEKKDAAEASPEAPKPGDVASPPKKRGRPKGSKNAKRGGRPKSVEKAIRDAYASGIRLYGRIAAAVKKATGQPVRFPAIAKALASVRPAKAAVPKKSKRGPGRPKGKRGRPKGTGRRGRPPKAVGVSGFLIVQGRKIAKAASVADVKARLARILAKADSLEGVEVYERRPVKIERKVTVSL